MTRAVMMTLPQIAIIFFILGLFFPQSVPAQEDELSQMSIFVDDRSCTEIYEQDGFCLPTKCFLKCVSGSPGPGCLVEICQPKPCIHIDPQYCPLDHCQVLKGCGENDLRCYFPTPPSAPSGCGDLGYIGPADCCEGLVKRCGAEFFDQSCDMAGEYTIYGVPVCVPCGNGICNQFENRCNCPEDCGD